MHSKRTEASLGLHRNALSSSPPLQTRPLLGWRETENTEAGGIEGGSGRKETGKKRKKEKGEMEKREGRVKKVVE